MGGSTRIAAVAAVSHGRQLYNYTHHDVYRGEGTQYNVNVFFIGATLCGVIVAVCAVCWRRTPSADKPEDLAPDLAAGVYTVSADTRLHNQIMEELPGPPPAYESVVHNAHAEEAKDYELQEVVTEACRSCQVSSPPDAELPSYEAAVLLRDTKL